MKQHDLATNWRTKIYETESHQSSALRNNFHKICARHERNDRIKRFSVTPSHQTSAPRSNSHEIYARHERTNGIKRILVTPFLNAVSKSHTVYENIAFQPQSFRNNCKGSKNLRTLRKVIVMNCQNERQQVLVRHLLIYGHLWNSLHEIRALNKTIKA